MKILNTFNNWFGLKISYTEEEVQSFIRWIEDCEFEDDGEVETFWEVECGGWGEQDLFFGGG